MNVFYIDTSLKEPTGHCLNYVSSLHRSLKDRKGISFTVIGSKYLDTQKCDAEFAILPHFTYECDARPLIARNVIEKIHIFRPDEIVMREHRAAMQEDLHKLFAELAIGGDDILIFNTLRQWQLLPALDFLQSLGKDKCPKTRFILHFTARPTPGGPDDVGIFYRRSFEVLQNGNSRDKIKILTDTEILRDEYIAYGCPADKIEVCPIPHTPEPLEAFEESNRNRAVTIGYLGEARVHKGFSEITEAVTRYEQAWPEEDDVNFKIHCFSYVPESAYMQLHLKRLETTRATLVKTQLSEDDYYTFLSSIDVVLLPYLVDNYYAQTSGIFAEAMAMGKIIIASRGTWMAEQLRKYACGVLCVAADSLSLAEAIHETVTHYANLKVAAVKAAVKWSEFHNPQVLLEQLL